MSNTFLSKRLASVSADEHQTQTQVIHQNPIDTQYSISAGEIHDLSQKVREDLNKVYGEQLLTRGQEDEFRAQMWKTIEGLLVKHNANLHPAEAQKFILELINDILGFGVIEPLRLDESITEIMVVGPNKVYIEQNGKLTLTNIKFSSREAVLMLINKIVAPIGRKCDESTPNVDARLPDGSRVSASIQPIALDGPYITIRKFGKKAFTLQDYVDRGSASPEMVHFIEAAVCGKLNIFVSGGTGTGKTTLLNCLSSYIDPKERILTIEDSAELQLTQPHVERYEARPANVEGKGAITIRDLVIYALRKRPDRIIVGEVRGGEAMDMLQAMNTGHDGSLTTGHANSPKQMMSRLETMALMSGMDIPVKSIRETIAGAVQLVVQIGRLKDGSRKIVAITEVVGFGKEGAELLGLKNYDKEAIYLQDIFRFEQKGLDANGKVIGEFVATGHMPFCLERIEAEGVHVDRSIFTASKIQ